ncbi:hypothetical protein, partial [Paenibacillus thiaminolyticus]|uniref:hypothetical protein n=1 Tax=Paenibacillus thiaminolyticus TaxID=49283 RepID=UPI002280551D
MEKGILQKCRNFTRFRSNTSQFGENDADAQQFRDISPDFAKIAALLQECRWRNCCSSLQGSIGRYRRYAVAPLQGCTVGRYRRYAVAPCKAAQLG